MLNCKLHKSNTNVWRGIERYTSREREMYKNASMKYSDELTLTEKIHTLNSVLPDIYEIIVRHETEIMVFDKMAQYLYGDETDTPLEILVNNII